MRFSIRNVTNADALNRYKEEEKTLLRNPALISMTASQEILKSCGNPYKKGLASPLSHGTFVA